ncbi:hypothetical protein Tsubulata_010731 [Turnera subulata]|uniref:DUF4283 domain-containing protein n=1 Tax=Turnera subulata TaxID=218843 RepID=A0A9Q0FP46_9ROSI|nr:hypothetical protein Tsubulata_010731 [Turnera subulata]
MSALHPAGTGQRPPANTRPDISPDVLMASADAPCSAPASFKEKLVANQASGTSAAEESFVEKEGDIVATQTPEGPVIKISDRYRAMLHKRWENTLIVKLWGRRIGFKSLCNKPPNLWKLKAGVRVVVLDNNFYFVRFYNRMDYLHALTNGPWIVFEHYLTVESWKPQFNPAQHKITSVVAWVGANTRPLLRVL